MADRTPSDNPLAGDRPDQTLVTCAGGQDPAWMEGIPHDFKGWGPQTPDPADAVDAVDLNWNGHEDLRHIVWRFDRPRHH